MANFLFVLSKEDNESATRCFQFAKVAHSEGHKVNLFFIDGGVVWADSTRDLTQKTVTGDCTGDHLPYLVQHEIYAGVCTPCARSRGLDESRFHKNMALDGGPHLIEMAAESTVFNF